MLTFIQFSKRSQGRSHLSGFCLQFVFLQSVFFLSFQIKDLFKKTLKYFWLFSVNFFFSWLYLIIFIGWFGLFICRFILSGIFFSFASFCAPLSLSSSSVVSSLQLSRTLLQNYASVARNSCLKVAPGSASEAVCSFAQISVQFSLMPLPTTKLDRFT